MQTKATSDLLEFFLRMSVPTEVQRMIDNPRYYENCMKNASTLAEVLSTQADKLMFKGKTSAEQKATQKCFIALTQALAMGALAPGGIQFLNTLYVVQDNSLNIKGLND